MLLLSPFSFLFPLLCLSSAPQRKRLRPIDPTPTFPSSSFCLSLPPPPPSSFLAKLPSLSLTFLFRPQFFPPLFSLPPPFFVFSPPQFFSSLPLLSFSSPLPPFFLFSPLPFLLLSPQPLLFLLSPH